MAPISEPSEKISFWRPSIAMPWSPSVAFWISNVSAAASGDGTAHSNGPAMVAESVSMRAASRSKPAKPTAVSVSLIAISMSLARYALVVPPEVRSKVSVARVTCPSIGPSGKGQASAGSAATPVMLPSCRMDRSRLASAMAGPAHENGAPSSSCAARSSAPSRTSRLCSETPAVSSPPRRSMRMAVPGAMSSRQPASAVPARGSVSSPSA